MKCVFWIAAATVLYTYVGYPGLLYLRKRFAPHPVRPTPIFPSVSIVMAVHNEGAILAAKLANLARLDYPRGLVQTVIASDGSTDATNEILRANLRDSFLAVLLERNEGKASALNHAFHLATGEIVFLTDVRQMLDPDSLRNLVANFADPSVGCVSGEYMIPASSEVSDSSGVGFYWNLEKKIRQWESDTNSVPGVTGAIYAIRRALIRPLPPGTILDDVLVPLNVVRQGKRVIFEPRSRAWETASFGLEREFRRKVRTLTGNYQLLQLAPWVLFRPHAIWFEFFSHKLLRLIVPFALLALLLSSAFIPGPFYRLSFILQVVFYAVAILGLLNLRLGVVARLASSASAFTVLNAAAATALWVFVVGKKQIWVR